MAFRGRSWGVYNAFFPQAWLELVQEEVNGEFENLCPGVSTPTSGTG